MVVLDTGASVSVVNRELIDETKIFEGKAVVVYDWRNNPSTLKTWTNISFGIGPVREKIACLVMEGVTYDLLVSRPLMKKIQPNLHHDDTISFGGSGESGKRCEQANAVGSIEDLEEAFPKVVSKSEYPPQVKFFEVPFVLKTDTPINKKPYKLSRLKQEFVNK